MRALAAVLLATAAAIWAWLNALSNIDARAVHADEAEQASTFLNLYDGRGYAYNPHGPHGPALYYWAYAAQKTLGASGAQIEIADLRKTMLPVAAAVFAAFFAISKAAPFSMCALAAAAFASTPVAQIYGAYFVHEIIFALACLLCACALFLFLKKPRIPTAFAVGLCAGAMQCCKETSVIAFAGLAAACAIFAGLYRPKLNAKATVVAALAALAGFAAVFVPLYSSFGANPWGMIDAFRSYYIHFFDKADSGQIVGEGLFYIKLLFWQKSSGVYFGGYFATSLALAGLVWAVAKPKEYGADAAIFFAAAAIVQIAILSAIPYKTPWLILAPVATMSPAAGFAAYKILSLRSAISLPLCALAAAAFIPQYKMTENALGRFNSDPRNPFIYSHTVSDEENLKARLLECAKYSKYGDDIPIAVITKVSPWPLPWQLRKFQNAGFWSHAPENLETFDVIICDAFTTKDALKKIDADKYSQDIFGLRKNTVLNVFIRKEIFDKIIGE